MSNLNSKTLAVQHFAFVGQSSSLVKRNYYKLLVIGDQNTGKTSIIHRYVHGCFRERYEVTVGAAINLKEIMWNDRDKLTLEFFDIGGTIIAETIDSI